jgi:hypothetical protein
MRLQGREVLATAGDRRAVSCSPLRRPCTSATLADAPGALSSSCNTVPWLEEGHGCQLIRTPPVPARASWSPLVLWPRAAALGDRRHSLMAAAPRSAPVHQPRPSARVHAAVPRIAAKTPRMVLDDPISGLPSVHRCPPSSGVESAGPASLFERTGAPFATVSRQSDVTTFTIEDPAP